MLFKNLKTSEKISLGFSLTTFLALFLLLVSINIIYFFIWYNDQKEESLYDMNKNYISLLDDKSIHSDNKEAFREYILQKDTIIIPENGESLICSEGVAKKLHNNMEVLERVKGNLFYKDGDKIYFIFSREYDEIGEVKILFDTTSYIKSQIIIIKISLVLIFIFLFFIFFLGKALAKYSLRQLKKIAENANNINIEGSFKNIQISGPKDDEIVILSETMNRSFEKIQNQTTNLKQFITDVSHEFKTPLHIINSKIDVYMKKKALGKDEGGVDNLLENIKNNTKKLNNLLETLFFLSRIEEGILCLKKEKVNFSSHIKKLTYNILGTNSKSIDISFHFQKKLEIKIDIITFDMILENLLSNAIKFSDEDGKIEIGCNENTFWIQDFGSGIESENLEKIWNKFYRRDVNKEGFGVGLFIVKRIIDIYNWKIKVESKKNVGTKFTIFF